ncbi:MAG: hypothetical protein R3E90_04715 [Marinicella sp.]
MKPVSAIDSIEAQIDSHQKAVELLSRLPKNHPQLNTWHSWSQDVFAQNDWLPVLQKAMTIAYARMTVRNGSLSPNPRAYHNEYHINDLLSRVLHCAKYDNNQINPEGLALLCFFAATHDLRQAEPPKSADDESLVGANEMASYQEAQRITELVPSDQLWTAHNMLLLKTMIEGSTFGSGGKRSKYFFQGNLAMHLLSAQNLLVSRDEQLVLLACDIDTANVSLPIAQFASSGIHIYNELITHQQATISAWQFFSEQQKIYFFEQQAYHAEISKTLFQPKKDANAKQLLALCHAIEKLPQNTPAETIKEKFINHAKSLGESA